MGIEEVCYQDLWIGRIGRQEKTFEKEWQGLLGKFQEGKRAVLERLYGEEGDGLGTLVDKKDLPWVKIPLGDLAKEINNILGPMGSDGLGLKVYSVFYYSQIVLSFALKEDQEVIFEADRLRLRQLLIGRDGQPPRQLLIGRDGQPLSAKPFEPYFRTLLKGKVEDGTIRMRLTKGLRGVLWSILEGDEVDSQGSSLTNLKEVLKEMNESKRFKTGLEIEHWEGGYVFVPVELAKEPSQSGDVMDDFGQQQVGQ